MTKLHLGCGQHVKDGWVNYDIDKFGNQNVSVLDLGLGRLPHESNSVDFIFTEHFIEHISLEQSTALLKDSFRVLKSGGVLRLSTPDLAALADKYVSRDVIKMPGVWEPATPAQMMNEGMRLWGHQFLYDAMDMTSLLIAIGFDDAYLVDWHESDYPELQNAEIRPYYDDLILEAIKL